MKRSVVAALVVVMGVCLSGCGGGGRKPTFPVTGKVTFGGKPAVGASVVFHPVDVTQADDLRPRGKVSNDGTLEVTTYSAKDGAPAGEYRLTVEWWLSPGGDAPPVNRLPAVFGKPESSNLRASVTKGPTTLANIELKR